MVIGYGVIVLRLPESRSLKAKRKVVKSVIGRIRSNFNASVAETGANDVHQRAEIGVAMVTNSAQLANSKLDQLLNMVEAMGLAEIVDTEMEIMHM